MNWTSWLLIGATIAGLYALGLIGYRLFLATRKLKREVVRAEALITELQQVEMQTVEFSRPTSGDEFEQALVNRELLKMARRRQAQDRKHRLIERISSIEVDKR